MPQIEDEARKWTDAELRKLERSISREYSQAAKEMREKQEKWLAKFNAEREQREKALDNTQEAMDAHKRWLQSQAVRGNWLRDMADQLAQSAHGANEKAAELVNDYIPHVFKENADMAAYAVERKVRADLGFTLVNEDAVRHIMKADAFDSQLIQEAVYSDPQFGPAAIQSLRKQEVDYPKDMRWNRRKFTSAITQGILQGESIPNIVKRTESIYGQNRTAAIRAARTATTNAENAGRMNSFERAERLGIDMEIEWLATLDGRTRESHRALDGERVNTGETFSNGLRWPGDPHGSASEVWNCRCRANGRVVGFDGKRGEWADDVGERWSRLPVGMTYEQWKAAKPVSRAESYANEAARVSGAWHAQQAAETVTAAAENGFAGIAEGQDILGMWQRRPDEFDFEIEDVMSAQGFDGKPRIVDANEFDRAVKAANGGDGLIMQRTYSAPDQATLDAYRDQLYHGKWYVDCSTGGAQYGQGMYAAADYTGTLTDGMRSEMEHYISLNRSRGAEHAYVETMTLDPSARVVTYEDAYKLFHSSPNRDSAIRQWADAYLRNDGESPLTDNEFAWVMRKSGVWKKDPSMTAAEWWASEPNISGITDSRMWSLDEDLSQEIMKGVKSGELVADDVGAHMVKLGYDAINAVGHGKSGSYTVVLNRTKLIIRRPE